eukprot:s10733_g2.t1
MYRSSSIDATVLSVLCLCQDMHDVSLKGSGRSIVPQTIDLSQQSVEMLTANAIGELGLVGDIPVTVCPGTVLARVA